jgi:hypothetical protein
MVIAGQKDKTAHRVRMVQCQRQGDERAPGVTDDDGTLDAEPCECLSQQISLPGGRPHRAGQPVAIPETGAVKRNNVTLSLSRKVEQPAQFEILGGNDIAMEKYDRPSTAPLEVVKSDTIDSNEPPTRWMLPLYFSCSIGVPERHPRHGSGNRSHQDRAVSRPLCQSCVQCIRHYTSDL